MAIPSLKKSTVFRRPGTLASASAVRRSVSKDTRARSTSSADESSVGSSAREAGCLSRRHPVDVAAGALRPRQSRCRVAAPDERLDGGVGADEIVGELASSPAEAPAPDDRHEVTGLDVPAQELASGLAHQRREVHADVTVVEDQDVQPAPRPAVLERMSPGAASGAPAPRIVSGSETSLKVATACGVPRSRSSKSAAVRPVTSLPSASVTTTSTTT